MGDTLVSAPLYYTRVPQFTLIICVDVQDTIIKNYRCSGGMCAGKYYYIWTQPT